MVPISDKIGTLFQLPLKINSYLSMEKRQGLVARGNATKNFILFILRLWKNNGSGFTIKWMKASSVALQRYLGDDKMVSLRELDPDLPLPRLNNGLPRHISVSDRVMIRNGDIRFIRFHLGLLNLYRVLEAPGNVKLSTITEGFTGDEGYLNSLIELVNVKKLIFFDLLKGFDNVRKMSLSPTGFVLSRSASPSNKMSAQGILTDILYLNALRPDLWQDILDYLYLVKPKVTKFVRMLQFGYELGTELEKSAPMNFTDKNGTVWHQDDPVRTKMSIRAHGLGPGLGLSQFAIKVEAAGKIRLFALMDSVTQSVLAPLHKAMFALLRIIPNDGTFDQEGSIRRSMQKAIKSNCGFSFDLTAATDRLPVILTAIIIEVIFLFTGLGALWQKIMCNRDFGFNSKIAEKLGISPGPYRYAVGQAMGALSSWPGLALTHHWIVQYAAFRVHISKDLKPSDYVWNEDYEILGDDLVIFDPLIADEYLKIMAGIGCGINMHKSIKSPNKPVFEFAKRTCIGDKIVSGISLGQVRAGWNVGSRVANALSFSNSGLITTPSMLATILTRYGNTNLSLKDLGLPAFALLGSLFQSGKETHRMLTHAIIDPRTEDFDIEQETVGLPVRSVLERTFNILSNDELKLAHYPYSHEDIRDEVFDEYESEFTAVILQKALKKATFLYENQDVLLRIGSMNLYFHPMSNSLVRPKDEDLPVKLRELFVRIEAFFNMLIEQDDARENPETLHDEVYDALYKHAKYPHIMKINQALDLAEKVERMEFKYTLKQGEAPGRTILESSPMLSVMRDMYNFAKVKSIFGPLSFADPNSVIKSYYEEHGIQAVINNRLPTPPKDKGKPKSKGGAGPRS
jgi:hypothetical protein